MGRSLTQIPRPGKPVYDSKAFIGGIMVCIILKIDFEKQVKLQLVKFHVGKVNRRVITFL